jgi:hypothetical protein
MEVMACEPLNALDGDTAPTALAKRGIAPCRHQVLFLLPHPRFLRGGVSLYQRKKLPDDARHRGFIDLLAFFFVLCILNGCVTRVLPNPHPDLFLNLLYHLQLVFFLTTRAVVVVQHPHAVTDFLGCHLEGNKPILLLHLHALREPRNQKMYWHKASNSAKSGLGPSSRTKT